MVLLHGIAYGGTALAPEKNRVSVFQAKDQVVFGLLTSNNNEQQDDISKPLELFIWSVL